MPKRIIVLGIMRSGTSLTAELIRLWGAYAGIEEHLWKSEVDDPRGYGYMEYKPLRDLNVELMNNNDRIPIPNEVLEKKATERDLGQKALSLLHDMDEQSLKNKFNTWVWKDPRLPLTLPFWIKFWGEAIYVITIRHPVETILSAAKMERLEAELVPLSAGFVFWQFCMLNLLTYTQESPKKIFVDYDQMVQDPERECKRLCQFLDEQCDIRRNPNETIQKMSAQVTTSQRHFSYPQSLAEIEVGTKEQRALFNFLRVKTMNANESFNAHDFALYPGWLEYLQILDKLMLASQQNGHAR